MQGVSSPAVSRGLGGNNDPECKKHGVPASLLASCTQPHCSSPTASWLLIPFHKTACCLKDTVLFKFIRKTLKSFCINLLDPGIFILDFLPRHLSIAEKKILKKNFQVHF